jgi:hypothetical protein
MPDWDYFPLYIQSDLGADDIMRDLQELGRGGWELVAVTPYETDASEVVAFFKRPLEHGEPTEPFVG